MIFLDLSSLANFNNFSPNGLTDMRLPWPTHLIPWYSSKDDIIAMRILTTLRTLGL